MAVNVEENEPLRSPMTAEELLPLIYDELRALAVKKLKNEKQPLTLQPTALVHEAYLRLKATYPDRRWDDQRTFFSTSSEVMRWILVDRARQKNTERHGGALSRIELPPELEANLGRIPDLVAFDEILLQLEAHDPTHAEYVKMRFFAGFTHAETAAALNMTTRQADHIRAVSRVWLLKKLGKT